MTSASFEKPPKSLRERAQTKAEAAGETHVVRVYNWPALKSMGIDKKEELEALGFVPQRQVDKDGNVWDMAIPTAQVEAMRKQRFEDAHGFAPGEEEVFGQHGEKASPLRGSKEVSLTTGREIAAHAGNPFDE